LNICYVGRFGRVEPMTIQGTTVIATAVPKPFTVHISNSAYNNPAAGNEQAEIGACALKWSFDPPLDRNGTVTGWVAFVAK
jgi:hypothetical protein